MSEEAAFLRTIQANPTDATAKLVYADWLDEHGEGEKAEYLRLAVKLQMARKLNDDEHRRFYHLQWRHYVWAELVRLVPMVWDAVTMFALGRLRGLLDAFATLNGHDSDISYDFDAHLYPRTGSVAEMAASHYGREYAPANLEQLADWETGVGDIFRDWLYCELRQLRNGPHTRLAFLADRGRDPGAALAHVRAVLRPTVGYRVQITRNDRFYAIDWADVVLEADDRVLFLHFSFSD